MSLRNNIMRRVYYAFALRMLVNRNTLHAALLGVSLYALAQLVFVAAVVQNLLRVEIGHVPAFVVSAFWHADMPTLLVFALSAGIFMSFVRRIRYQPDRTLRAA